MVLTAVMTTTTTMTTTAAMILELLQGDVYERVYYSKDLHDMALYNGLLQLFTLQWLY
jgi:hypothetical protein